MRDDLDDPDAPRDRPVRLAVSLGCPCGIGPEVAAVAAAQGVPGARIVLYGDAGALAEAARRRGVDLGGIDRVAVSDLPPGARRPGAPGVAAGVAQLAAVDTALAAVLGGEADALVTGPVSKLAITRAGVDFLGHTEYLAAMTGTARVVMLFAGPRLRTSLVTTHLAIAALPARVTRDAVAFTVILTARSLARDFGVARPRVAVTGLNPHAGEGGLLGLEDTLAVEPGVQEARDALGQGCRIDGPLPAEGAFRAARDGRYDAVVAMYHDQATIASKLLDFGDAVNVTLGLPFVRTSVDHGTAYDIAGRGIADAHGMLAALTLATTLARGRRGAD